MKNTDVAAIIVIASVSMLIAYFVASAVIGQPSGGAVKVKTIKPITATVVAPDPTIFNSSAINPTVDVTIGGN